MRRVMFELWAHCCRQALVPCHVEDSNLHPQTRPEVVEIALACPMPTVSEEVSGS